MRCLPFFHKLEKEKCLLGCFICSDVTTVERVSLTPLFLVIYACVEREEDIKIVEKKIILHTHIVVIGCHNSKTFNYKIFILSFPATHIIWIFTEKKGRRSQLMTVLGYLSLSLLLRVLTWRYSLMNRGNIVTFWVIWFLFVLVRLVAARQNHWNVNLIKLSNSSCRSVELIRTHQISSQAFKIDGIKFPDSLIAILCLLSHAFCAGIPANVQCWIRIIVNIIIFHKLGNWQRENIFLCLSIFLMCHEEITSHRLQSIYFPSRWSR